MAKVITFFGADSQVGCTMTAASVVQALKNKKTKPLLILASSQIEEGWFGDNVSSDLGVLLRLNKISKEDVMGSIVRTGDFDFIRGSKDPLKKQWFDVTIIGKIVEIAASEYDYIILDGGWDISLPLAMSALTYSQRRFYVVNGSEKELSRFTTGKAAVIDGLGLDYENDCVVLNKYDTRKLGGKYDFSQVKSKLNMDGFTVPLYDNPASYELDKICPYNKAGGAYMKAINAIADDIIKAGK